MATLEFDIVDDDDAHDDDDVFDAGSKTWSGPAPSSTNSTLPAASVPPTAFEAVDDDSDHDGEVGGGSFECGGRFPTVDARKPRGYWVAEENGGDLVPHCDREVVDFDLFELDGGDIASDLSSGAVKILKDSGGQAAKCDRCGKWQGACETPLRRCSHCRLAQYCSVPCQRAAWANGHKQECGRSAPVGCEGNNKASSAGIGVPAPTVIGTDRSTTSVASTSHVQRSALGEAATRLEHEAMAWQMPVSPLSARHQAVASIHVQRMLPVLLDAHAGSEWTEHHTSGLLDPEDLKLPSRSSALVSRLRERLLHAALAECLEEAGSHAVACGACARAAFSSHGWVDVYHRWDHCLRAAGREDDVPATYEVAVSRGVWQHAMQRPNDLYVPGLRPRPLWSVRDVPAALELEAAFPTILREYRALRDWAEGGSWTPVADQPLILKGDWRDFKLVENGKRHPVNCVRCPETIKLIQDRCPEIATQIRGSLIFSRLAGGTRIRPHCGPTNARIRIHLALEVPDPAPRIRVGSEWRQWEVGRCLIFDDSFEHEVVHDGDEARVVLIADFWHPDFGDDLRKKYLHGRHWRRYQEALNDGWHEGSEPHRVDPSEVRFLEGELRAVGGVREAAATVHFEEAVGRQTLIAYIECKKLSPGSTPEDVCGRCAERLKHFGLSTLVLAVLDWPRA
eukprot:CAMPEP_0203977108 /NCGR_PEP_ID=MMETSP0359-20131031/101450_1 /ASSEMBLY_ACC=CAM_ASM_000338 /TAXON_ID=268821 /ORGANISM="Scrippsiella Hangoei, Strain SHTV-5" /LENGTH=679 /DNA_ID=CAMNT_0050915317 /DNA_START=30 /DNA_END=2065 /DNA_ORIENTATION=-